MGLTLNYRANTIPSEVLTLEGDSEELFYSDATGDVLVATYRPRPEAELDYRIVTSSIQLGALQESATVIERYLAALRPVPPVFRRGDIDGDGTRSLVDVLLIVGYLYERPSRPLACLDTADVDNNGRIALADPINLMKIIYLPADEAPSLSPDCEWDDVDDSFRSCRRQAECEDASG